MIDRLAAYEDTGLEPEEVMELARAGEDGRDLYRRALSVWGADAQTLMVFEEMAELQKELCKSARGKDNRDDIADEIADVLIMLGQMMVLHDCEQTVEEHKVAKLKRLKDRITRAEAEAALERRKGEQNEAD